MIDFVRMRVLLKAVPAYWSKRDDIIQGAALKGVQYSDMPRSPGYSNTKLDDAMVRLEDIEEAYHDAIV